MQDQAYNQHFSLDVVVKWGQDLPRQFAQRLGNEIMPRTIKMEGRGGGGEESWYEVQGPGGVYQGC